MQNWNEAKYIPQESTSGNFMFVHPTRILTHKPFPEVPSLPLDVVVEVVAPPGVEVRLVELGHVLGRDGVPRRLVGIPFL